MSGEDGNSNASGTFTTEPQVWNPQAANPTASSGLSGGFTMTTEPQAEGGSDKGGFGCPGFGSGWDGKGTSGGFGGGFESNSKWDTGAGVSNYSSNSKWDFEPRNYKFNPPVVPEMKIKKNFYEEHPDVTGLSEAQVADIRKGLNDIKVEDKSGQDRPLPKPVTSFQQAFHNYPEILETIAAQNFEKPSPIQSQMWPVALSGYDAIGIAQTGTGKTLGFLLPAFVHIEGQELPRTERGGPSALVLTPTRELAQQIRDEVRKYRYKGIRSVCVYGGGTRRDQASICREGVDIVIATPGRLGDLVGTGDIVLPSITFLVLDEADRMLDMGFEPQIRDIIAEIREDRHTVMTSATWPKGVQRMADKYLKEPFLVFVGSLSLTACHNVSQHVGCMRESEKSDELFNFLSQMTETDKALVFVARKLKCDSITSTLRSNGIQCEVMHGDRDQCQREDALNRFKQGISRVLVATDVASRGLDVRDITHVLNYDFPSHIEEYVHRIGRSGRAGKLGMSVTFITKRDMHQAGALIKILEEAGQPVPDGIVRWHEEFEASKPPAEDLANLSLAPPGATSSAAGFADPNANSRERRRERYRRDKPEPGAFYDPFTGEKIGMISGAASKS